jgi:hypothetical protein
MRSRICPELSPPARTATAAEDRGETCMAQVAVLARLDSKGQSVTGVLMLPVMHAQHAGMGATPTHPNPRRRVRHQGSNAEV